MWREIYLETENFVNEKRKSDKDHFLIKIKFMEYFFIHWLTIYIIQIIQISNQTLLINDKLIF